MTEKITAFKAFDGSIHLTKNECDRHELMLTLSESFAQIKERYEDSSADNSLFCYDRMVPFDDLVEWINSNIDDVKTIVKLKRLGDEVDNNS